jgi:outer membrane murein-binding lipoprotein Lpp
MANRFLLTAAALSAILALSGCACSDFSDQCPTNIWVKPV